MEIWKRNLYILWFAQFMATAAMNLVVPFLPLYLAQDLGMTDPGQIQNWTGLIFGANFLTAFIFSPIWGKIADRAGRKIMIIRSGFGMALVTVFMGLVTSPAQLLGLRLLNGVVAGFIPAAIALVSTNTPKERVGYSLGILQSGAVAGTILGPLLGGLFAEWMSFRQIFIVTGILLFFATVLVIATVKEINKPHPNNGTKAVKSAGDFKRIMAISPLPSLFLTGFLIQFAIMSTNPFMTAYVQDLWHSTQFVSLVAGFVISCSGIATMLFSPLLGKWGDKVGSKYILLFSLLGTTIFLIPQAVVHDIWTLMIFRFLMGMCLGGLVPSVNALIQKFAPQGMESLTFGYSNSALFLGNLLGPIIGGVLSAAYGINCLFLLAGTLFLINTIWVKIKLHPHESPRSLLEHMRYNQH
ncbi:MFS transporter [Aneurinibacillus sp. Ricciae_BoGa-3]|uniref:MFS transporter n=1 Tax=Aneurinibacillus sp. Ricciae_BoGa-3 TaxID=3022697 RepID=UPI00233F87F7|nr:MFS transporter [Aneurinibacillus sp. Ricciae_BoGa-3]WCK55616.1 MFS transporter [Aneurinibacillus sp. Ricciae_BoGa-3]